MKTSDQELDKKVADLENEFKGLSEEQKELLLYRKIIDLATKNKGKNFSDVMMDSDGLLTLIKTADLSVLKPLIIYVLKNNQLLIEDVYKESLVCYNNVLDNYKRLAQELNINSSLELSHLFTYMLWNGYFSVTKEHFYKLKERLLLPGMNSFDVIKGKGVCLAYAELLANYLNKCDIDATLLTCKVPTQKNAIKFDYRPKIERNVKITTGSKIVNNTMNLFLGGLINKLGNHAITLINENGKMYAYDSTNLYGLNIEDQNTASIINGTGEFKIKPIPSIITNPNNNYIDIFEKLFAGNYESALTRKEFIFSFENLMELVNKNISILDDAYNNIHADLEFIDKQTDEIGGCFKVLKKIKKKSNSIY